MFNVDASVRRLHVALGYAVLLGLMILLAAPAAQSRAASSLSIQSPLEGAISNNSTPTFSGTTEDPLDEIVVNVYSGPTAGTGMPVTVTTLPVGEAWSAGPTGTLADGLYTAQAVQTSLVTGPVVSNTVSFTVDTSSPSVSLAQPVSPSNDRAPSFSGEAGGSEDVTVHIFDESHSQVATASASPSGGSWVSGAASPALPAGRHTFTAQASEPSALGNPEGVSNTVSFTVDTSSPSVSLAQPVSPSNDRAPSFSGEAGGSEDVTVHIFDESHSQVATASASPSGGSWVSGAASPALPAGRHTFTAQASEPSALGNPEGVSNTVSFTVDTSSPSVSLAQPVSPSNDRAPSFSGEAGGSEDVTVHIFDESHSQVATASASPSGGSWVSGAASPALPAGRHTFTAQASEPSALGNPEGVSNTVTFTVDTLPPTVSLEPPPEFSNDATPTFSGTASDSTKITVRVYDSSGTHVTSVTAKPAGGSWVSGPATLSGGRHTYTAVASQPSSIGNPEGVSKRVVFTVDTDAPTVTLDAPSARLDNSTPSFSGSASEFEPVTVNVYAGEAPSGQPVATALAPGTGGAWISGRASLALPDGVYTARAEQTSRSKHLGQSRSYTFAVDTHAPLVGLSLPLPGAALIGESQRFEGTAGTDAHDRAAVTLQLYAGSAIGAAPPLQSVEVSAAGGRWAATLTGLTPGAYAVRAVQADEAGNVGASEARSFSIVAPPTTAPAPVSGPTASFTWFPQSPVAGEPVTLVSTSVDPSSAITSYSWDLLDSGAFSSLAQSVRTTFASAGGHVVLLRVADAAARVSTVAETISVGPAPMPLMRPFPLVRLSSIATRRGARMGLVSVTAGVGAHVTVRCTGRGCPRRSETLAFASRRRRVVTIELRHFERSFAAGAVLEIRVSQAGLVGKFTRLKIRRGALPLRRDACVSSTSQTPFACPAR